MKNSIDFYKELFYSENKDNFTIDDIIRIIEKSPEIDVRNILSKLELVEQLENDMCFYVKPDGIVALSYNIKNNSVILNSNIFINVLIERENKRGYDIPDFIKVLIESNLNIKINYISDGL